MKINTNSWHYKLVASVCGRYDVSNSLCTYFWQVMFSLFWRVVQISGFLFLLALACLVIYVLYQNFGIWFFVAAGFFAATLACQVAGPWSFNPKIRKVLFYEISISNKEKPDSLLTAWIKAKKQKVCPHLEFVDDRRKK